MNPNHQLMSNQSEVKISTNTTERHNLSMTAVSSPIKRKVSCIIFTLIIGIITIGAVIIIILRYYRQIKAIESTTTTLAELMTVTFSSLTTTTTVSKTLSTIVSTTSLTTTTTATVSTTSSTMVSTASLTTMTTISTVCNIFYEETPYSNGKMPNAIAIADTNNDNVSDVFISYAGEFSIEIILHGDHGTILSQTKHNNNAAALSITLGDIDADNRLDIITVNVYQGTYTVGISLNTGNGSFSIPKLHHCDWDVLQSIAVIDFNEDKNLDVVVAEYKKGRIYLLRNTGGDYLNCYTSYDVGSLPSSIVIGNMDGYHHLDIVVANSGSSTITFLYHKGGDHGFNLEQSAHLGYSPSSIAIADLNNDGYLDIIITFSNSDLVGVFLNKGQTYFSSLITYTTGRNPKSVLIADINGDHKYDIVTGSFDDNTISILLNAGNGTFLPRITYRVNWTPKVIAVTDVNSDKKPDIIFADEHSNYVGILLHC